MKVLNMYGYISLRGRYNVVPLIVIRNGFIYMIQVFYFIIVLCYNILYRNNYILLEATKHLRWCIFINMALKRKLQYIYKCVSSNYIIYLV